MLHRMFTAADLYDAAAEWDMGQLTARDVPNPHRTVPDHIGVPALNSPLWSMGYEAVTTAIAVCKAFAVFSAH